MFAVLNFSGGWETTGDDGTGTVIIRLTQPSLAELVKIQRRQFFKLVQIDNSVKKFELTHLVLQGNPDKYPPPPSLYGK